MKIDTELKEILFDCWNSAINNVGTGTSGSGFFDWIENNQDKILALGKPEPLAKNKADGSLDLEKIQNKIDEILESMTPAEMLEWLESERSKPTSR